MSSRFAFSSVFATPTLLSARSFHPRPQPRTSYPRVARFFCSTSTMIPKPATVRIIHYNDVYNIAEGKNEPVGGAARFITAVNAATSSASGGVITTFAGDAFSPAPLTPYTKGEEIPPVLNAAATTVACVGNHELDNGVAVMKQRVSECNFPWLLSNLRDRATNAPLGDVAETAIVERDGVRFGFMGLASLAWIETLSKIEMDDVAYEDFVKSADRNAADLRDQGADVICAITHLMQPDDERLAREAVDVDLILGGHDHIVWQDKINGRWAIKAGTDFKTYATIDVHFDGENVAVDDPIVHEVTRDVKADPNMSDYVEKAMEPLSDPSLDKQLAICKTLLDGRFLSVRTQETAIGNLVCDALADIANVPIAICNGGSLRANNIDPPSPLTQRELEAMLPFNGECVVVRYSGDELLDVLEASVSEYPLLSGRFCQVSGLKFSFDPRKPSGQRVDKAGARARVEGGEFVPITNNREYTVLTKTYMFIGKDGFPVGDEKDIVRTEELTCPQMVAKYLSKIETDKDCDGVNELGVVAPKPEGRITCVAPDPKLLEQYKLPASVVA